MSLTPFLGVFLFYDIICFMAELKNTKHERFCLEYIKDKNGTQAYIRAGYSPKGARVNATRLLAKDNISARIEELRKPIKEKLKIDAEWILKRLKENDTECRQAGEYANSNKALDQMAKIIGAYEKKEDAKTDDNVILKAFAESLAGVYVKKPE